MKRWKKLWCCLLMGCTLAAATGQTVFAQKGGNEESYTYTVTLYAGKQGEFSGTKGVQVDNHTTGSSYQIEETEAGGGQIRITGLEYGDRVMVSAQSCVSLTEDSKYYVSGIRESGRDNNTVGSSAFLVDSDREYVAAYGIKGNMVAYVVNYQDEEGNALAESQTFYGTVGDQPVVAFQYFENYQPQAYNLTKTLSDNEAENVFTFVYQRVSGQTGTVPAAPGADEDGNQGAGNVPGDGQGAGNTPGDGQGAGNVPGDGADGNGDQNGGDDGLVENPDEQVPQDLVNLDDEETPLADLKEVAAKERPAGNMPFFIGIAVVAAVGLGTLLTALWRKKKKTGKRKEESDAKAKEAKKEEKNSEHL